MPETQLHADLAALTSLASLSDHAIVLAEGTWLERKAMLTEGFKADNDKETEPTITEYVAHRDSFLSVARYCDEAREILSQYKSGDGITTSPDPEASYSRKILAVDPHIISAYCEFWDPGSHTGFEFLKREIDTDENELNNYRLFVYASLLTGTDLALLDPARGEISKMLAYFFQHQGAARNSEPTLTDRELFDALKNADLAGNIYRHGESRLAYLHQKAIDLATTKAGAAGQQMLSLARLTRILEDGRFYQSEDLVRHALGDALKDDEEEKIGRFAALIRAVRARPDFANDSLIALDEAYRQFRATDYLTGQTAPERQHHRSLRPGEMHDLAIINELNIVNQALRLCGVDAELYYVTLSTRMYNFLSGFAKTDILAPIIHPRTALIYQENKLARDQKIALDAALSSPIAFGHGMKLDQIVRPSEIDKFTADMGTILTATRETFSYSVLAKIDGLDQFISTFEHIFAECPDPVVKADYPELIASLRENLDKITDDVGSIYRDVVIESLFEKTYIAYEAFSHQFLKDQYVAIRKFEHQGVTRYTAIPVTRGYRHMFFIHNSFIDEALKGKITSDTKRMTMSQLLTTVRAAIDNELTKAATDSSGYAKAIAARAFVRALYAACKGEWNLVQSMASAGLRSLNLSENSDLAAVPSADVARGHLLAQELHFLDHLAERALAESSANSGQHRSRLSRAVASLHRSSKVSAGLPKCFAPFSTPYSPMSIRDALAAIGLLIEWNMKGVWRQATPRDNHLPALLTATTNPEIAWQGLEILTTDTNRPSDPEGVAEFATQVIAASAQLIERAKACHDHVSASHQELHSKSMWSYLVLRAHTMHLTALHARDLPRGRYYRGLDSDALRNICQIRDDHSIFIANCPILPEDEFAPHYGSKHAKAGKTQDSGAPTSEQVPDNNPFLSGLIAIETFVASTTDRDGSARQIGDLAASLTAFAAIETSCNRLNRFGFPRLFLRKIKEQLAQPIIANLTRAYGKDRQQL